MKLAVTLEYQESSKRWPGIKIGTIVLVHGKGGNKDLANVSEFPKCFDHSGYVYNQSYPRKHLRFLTSEERQMARLLYL